MKSKLYINSFHDQEYFDKMEATRCRYFIVGGTDNDKPIKYAILGPVKCGTCSLQEYYRAKYPDVETVRLEIIWKDDAFNQWEEFLKDNPNTIPIIITRNPADAMWSNYWYFKQRRKELSFEDWLKRPIHFDRQGDLRSPAHGYNFPLWIKRWEKYNVQVVSLDELKSQPDFPQRNIASEKPERKRKWWGWKDNKFPTMTTEQRKMAEEAMKLEIIHK